MDIRDIPWVDLIRPHTVLGFLGLLSLLVSFFYSLARRDEHHALFFICLGWHFAFAEVVWRIYTGYGWVACSRWARVHSAVSAVLLDPVWFLVLPLALTIPASSFILRVGAQRPAHKSKWWVVSTLVFALCILLIVLLCSLTYSLSGSGM
ncbi:MAG: hypothetical protein FJ291_33565 [Planctomycetes bacterium]|nr:hypothetical protein [Planctomycetota bacterium]